MKEHEKNLEIITRTYGLEKLGNGPDDVVQVETLKNQRLTILTGYMHVSDMRSKKNGHRQKQKPVQRCADTATHFVRRRDIIA